MRQAACGEGQLLQGAGHLNHSRLRCDLTETGPSMLATSSPLRGCLLDPEEGLGERPPAYSLEGSPGRQAPGSEKSLRSVKIVEAVL